MSDADSIMAIESGDRIRPSLSVVVPVYNEEASIIPLVEAVREALGHHANYELVLVDDGSVDSTVSIARRAAAGDRHVRVICLARNYGQTAAMQAGFDHALGEIVISMDGDLQNDPADIPRLVSKLHEGFDLVSGYRVQRQDRVLTRKVPSWFANRIIRIITGVPIRDNGCSLKAYRRELLKQMHLYAEMHRFIPAVAAATAGARIAEIPVRHHARRFGESKYGLSRVWKVLIDLLTIAMIRSFRDRPLLMFGLMGGVAALLGSITAIGAVISAFFFTTAKAEAYVLPAVAILLFGLSGFGFMLGLLGEVAIGEFRRDQSVEPLLLREDAP